MKKIQQYSKSTITYSKVIKVIWPIAQLFIGATFHAGVRGCVIHGCIGENTGKQETQS